MFKRLILEDWSTVCVLTAFVTAATIFLAITWRALRMPRAQAEHFARLPFTPDTPSRRHDPSA
jgi:hypothetical protein